MTTNREEAEDLARQCDAIEAATVAAVESASIYSLPADTAVRASFNSAEELIEFLDEHFIDHESQ